MKVHNINATNQIVASSTLHGKIWAVRCFCKTKIANTIPFCWCWIRIPIRIHKRWPLWYLIESFNCFFKTTTIRTCVRNGRIKGLVFTNVTILARSLIVGCISSFVACQTFDVTGIVQLLIFSKHTGGAF